MTTTRDVPFAPLSPDTVAETVDGITAVPGLYEALWGLLTDVPYVSPEVQEEPVYGGANSMSALFHKLSPEHQDALRKLAPVEQELEDDDQDIAEYGRGPASRPWG